MKNWLEMCHNMTSELSEDGVIATVKKSKVNFSEKYQCQVERAIHF